MIIFNIVYLLVADRIHPISAKFSYVLFLLLIIPSNTGLLRIQSATVVQYVVIYWLGLSSLVTIGNEFQ